MDEEVIMIYGLVMHWTFGALSLKTRKGRILLFAEMKLLIKTGLTVIRQAGKVHTAFFLLIA